jgi:hypothetical protein
MLNLGAAAFWISLAAVLIAGGWFKSRSEAQKHETLRRIVERTGTINEAQLRELFSPPAFHWADPKIWNPPPPPPGNNYKALRVLGTIALAIAGGLAILFAILGNGGVNMLKETVIGFGIAGLIAAFGVGLFAASSFVQRPPANDGKDVTGPAP